MKGLLRNRFILCSVVAAIVSGCCSCGCGGKCDCNGKSVSATADWQSKDQFDSPKSGLSDMKFIWE